MMVYSPWADRPSPATTPSYIYCDILSVEAIETAEQMGIMSKEPE